MLKFLRKYQLVLLAVAGSLLMVVFLLQPLLTNFGPNPGKRTMAYIGPDGYRVTALELNQAQQELNVLEPFLGAFSQLGLSLDEDDDNRAWHWYMLAWAASEGGFVGGPQDAVAFYRGDFARALAQQQVMAQLVQQFGSIELVQMLMQQPNFQQQLGPQIEQEISNIRAAFTDPEQRAQFAANRGLSLEELDTLFAKVRGVLRMQQAYTLAALTSSEQQVVEAASSALGTAVLDAVFVPAAAFEDEVEITQEAVFAQFDRLRDTQIGEPSDDNPLGFGYLQPPRVKLRYLKVDASAIAERVRVPLVEVRKEWTANKAAYDDRFADFAEARPAIEQQLRGSLVERVVGAADEVARGLIAAELRGVSSIGGYRDLPDDFSPPTLESLRNRIIEEWRERFPDSFEGELPVPEIFELTSSWQDSADLRNAPGGFGAAVINAGSRQIPTNQIPFFVLESKPDENTNAELLPLQVGVPHVLPPAVLPQDDSHYYFIVTDARPTGPADSVDEVIEQVRDDLRRELAYEALLNRRDELGALAEEQGLAAVADRFPTPETLTDSLVDDPADAAEEPPAYEGARALMNLQLGRGGIRPLDPTETPDQRLNDQAFRDAVLAAAAGLNPDELLASGEGPVVVVPVANQMTPGLAIARVRGYRPLTREDFLAQGEATSRANRTQQVIELQNQSEGWPFSYDQAKLRYNLRLESEAGPTAGPLNAD